MKECRRKLIDMFSNFNKKIKQLSDNSDDKSLINILYEMQTLIRNNHKASNDTELFVYLIETYTKKCNFHENLGLEFVNSFIAICCEYIRNIKVIKQTLKEISSSELLEQLKLLENDESKNEIPVTENVAMYNELQHLRKGKTQSALHKAFLFGKKIMDNNIRTVQTPVNEENINILFIQKLMENLVKENRINNFFINLRAQHKLIDLIPLLEIIDNSDIFPGLIKIAKYSNNPKAITPFSLKKV